MLTTWSVRPSAGAGWSRSRSPVATASAWLGSGTCSSVRSFGDHVLAVVPRRAGGSVLRPARHVDHLTGDEARLVADQERDRGGDVLGAADPLHRDLRGHRLLELFEVHAHP